MLESGSLGKKKQKQKKQLTLSICSKGSITKQGFLCLQHRKSNSDSRYLWRSQDLFAGCHFHALEKEMATHSSALAWRIPGTEEPGGLPSMGSHRVRHD